MHFLWKKKKTMNKIKEKTTQLSLYQSKEKEQNITSFIGRDELREKSQGTPRSRNTDALPPREIRCWGSRGSPCCHAGEMATSSSLYSIPESNRNHTGELTSGHGGCSPSPVEAMRRYMESLPQEVTCKEELCNFHFWKAVRTEFLATLLLTVLGCGSCLRWKAPPTDGSVAAAVELRVALAFGLGVATLVQCVGQVSGAHMNPAVSVALLVTRHITVTRTAAYVTAQCLGGVAGAGILYGLTPPADRSQAGLGATEPAVGVEAGQAFGMEFLPSVVVVLTVLSNMDPQRTEMGFRALSIGLSYVVGHLLAAFSVHNWAKASPISMHFIRYFVTG